jgi:sodium-independent sulfate anion transporter 11
LVAGGFGYGHIHSDVPREVAAVVPYRDGRLFENSSAEQVSDVETGDNKPESSFSNKIVEERSWEPVMPESTPFFHIDLTSAVRAAEGGLNRVSKLDSDKVGSPAD